MDALLVYVAYRHHAAAWLAASMAVAGSLCGSFVLYFLARKGGELYLARYTSKGSGAVMRRWFARYGLATVFVPAVLPIPMPLKVPVLSAGALGVRPWTFGGVLLVARGLRYFGLAWMGTQLGDRTLPYLKAHAAALLLIAAALFTAIFLLAWLTKGNSNVRRESGLTRQPESSGVSLPPE